MTWKYSCHSYFSQVITFFYIKKFHNKNGCLKMTHKIIKQESFTHLSIGCWLGFAATIWNCNGLPVIDTETGTSTTSSWPTLKKHVNQSNQNRTKTNSLLVHIYSQTKTAVQDIKMFIQNFTSKNYCNCKFSLLT